MLTFQRLYEAMERDMSRSSPLMDSGDETTGMRVIRSGMALRDDDDSSFWEDFISLCNDAEGMADLLGIKREAVTSWASRIREALDKVQQHDQQREDNPDEDQEMIPTGENGAMTRDNMGPFGPTGGI